MKYRIKSQLYSDAEAQKKVGAVLDDCGQPSGSPPLILLLLEPVLEHRVDFILCQA